MLVPLARTFLLGDAMPLYLTDSGVVVVLLMLVFGVAIGFVLACLINVLSARRGSHSPVGLPQLAHRAIAILPVRRPLLPGSWIAVAGTNLTTVKRALGIEHATSCSWDDGLAMMRQHKVFITPPQNGWILVFGAALPDPATDVDQCFLRLSALSRKLGTVQYFSSKLAPLQFSWVMLDHGKVVRAHAWSGQTLWNQGPVTKAESECGLICLDYGEENEASGGFQVSRMIRNAEQVAELAGRWGIHPALVAARLGRSGLGLAGEISRTKAH